MACFEPDIIPAWTRGYGKHGSRSVPGKKLQEVRCGKCIDCREDRRKQWTIRLTEEQKVSDTAYFITLTYEDNYLPWTPDGVQTLDPTDLRNYFKRIRRKMDYTRQKLSQANRDDLKALYPDLVPTYQRAGKDLLDLKQIGKLRYYAVGEYGTDKERPHYHAIVFGLPRILKNELVKKWSYQATKKDKPEQMGFVKVGTVTEASIHYVAGYMMNGRSGNDIRENEFARMSQKLGDTFIWKHGNPQNGYTDVANKKLQTHNDKYNDGRSTWKMPRRFKDHIFTKKEKAVINELNYMDALQRQAEKDRELIRKGYDPAEWREVQKRERIRQFKRNKKNKKL